MSSAVVCNFHLVRKSQGNTFWGKNRDTRSLLNIEARQVCWYGAAGDLMGNTCPLQVAMSILRWERKSLSASPARSLRAWKSLSLRGIFFCVFRRAFPSEYFAITFRE